MVRLISATLSPYLVRGAVLSVPLLLAATGSMGCATPVPFTLPTDGVNALGGDPNAVGGAPDFGGSPAVGGDDGSSAGSVSAGGDTTSAGASSAGASSSDGGSGTFGGATSSGGSSAGAPTAAGGSGTAGAGTAGSASAGAGGATAGGSCAAAFATSACLNLTIGSKVSVGGHNWTCSDDNCRNCQDTPACEPAMSGCPWGAVWTDNGGCT
jgi:hypothetical protein